jgi:hypothetical protein
MRRALFWRYSTLLDTIRRYSTLLDATRRYATLRYATLRYATLRYSTILYATLRYFTLLYATRRNSTQLDATRRYSTQLVTTRRFSIICSSYALTFHSLHFFLCIFWLCLTSSSARGPEFRLLWNWMNDWLVYWKFTFGEMDLCHVVNRTCGQLNRVQNSNK